MIIQVGISTAGNKKEFQGLSTDAKPLSTQLSPIGTGSTFYELDTKKAFIFDSSNTNPVTTNGWWEV